MDPIIEELQARAKAVVAAPQKNYAEMGAVHRAITGTHYNCTPCNESRILFTLDSFINHPERYALRIKEALTEMEEVQKSNYRFSRKATSKLIVLVTAFGTIKVTPENLTDEKAELVLKHRQYAHNIERIPGTKVEGEQDSEPEGDSDPEGDNDADDTNEDSEDGNTDPEGDSAEGEGETGSPEVSGLAPNGNVITLELSRDASVGKEENPVGPTEPKALTLKEAQAKYQELTGQPSGTRKLETLLAAIKKAEESK